MKEISKYFKTQEKAEAFRDRLEEKYEVVICSKWPESEERGNYSWLVSEAKNVPIRNKK